MRQSIRSLHACWKHGYGFRRQGVQPDQAVDRFLADPRNHPNDPLGLTGRGEVLTCFGAALSRGWLSWTQFCAMRCRGANLDARNEGGDLAFFAVVHEPELLLHLAIEGFPSIVRADGWTIHHELARTYVAGQCVLTRYPRVLEAITPCETRDGRTPLTVYLQHFGDGHNFYDMTVARHLCQLCGVRDIDTAAALRLGSFDLLKVLAEFGADLNAGLRAA